MKALILFITTLILSTCKTTPEQGEDSKIKSLSSSGGILQKILNQDCNRPLTNFYFTDSKEFDPVTGYSLLWVSRFSENDPRTNPTGPASIESTQNVYKELGLQNPVVIPSPRDNMRAVVLESAPTANSSAKIIVTFRHSVNNQNWLQNGLFFLRYANERSYHVGEKLHSGFSNSIDSFWKELVATVKNKKNQNPDARVIVVGHSLGAAFATISTIGLILEGIKVDYAYVSGAPQVGTIRWTEKAEEILAKSGTALYRISGKWDVIAHLPNNGRINLKFNVQAAAQDVLGTYFKGFGDFVHNALHINKSEQTTPKLPNDEDVRQLASVKVMTESVDTSDKYGVLGKVYTFDGKSFVPYSNAIEHDNIFWQEYFGEINRIYQQEGLQKSINWVTSKFIFHNVFGSENSYSCSYFNAIRQI